MSNKLSKFFANIKSENMAGYTSLLGSTVVLANSFNFSPESFNGIATTLDAISYNGDSTNLYAAALFTLGEISLAKKGHMTGGYSFGAAALGAGDIVLIFSEASQGNPYLQASLAAMAAFWTIGAMKYPLEKAAKNLSGAFKEYAEVASNAVPKICGFGNLGLRAPGAISALAVGNYPVAFAVTCWGAADIMAGRLQDTAKEIRNYTVKQLGL